MADGKSAPAVGEVVAGNYQILGTAGVGGMGVVYRALDLKLQRTVALKFLPPDLSASDRDKQRFLQEARTASALDHPNIGVIHGIEETGDDLAGDTHTFIVMAYYEGQSLLQRIRSGPLPPAEAADIAIQVLKALDCAHTQGIEHRDVKPSNIMLTQQRMVKLVDFGLARVSQQTASKTQGVSGTVSYMSPEQTLGRAIDSRSDIWGTGIVLAEMLTGQNPFLRETIPATVYSILNEVPPVQDEVPPGLRQIVYRALSKDPVRRYQNAREMIADLEAVRPELPAVADPNIGSAVIRRMKESSELRRSRQSASASAWMQPAQRGNQRLWFILAAVVLFVAACLLLIPPLRQKVAALLPGGSAAPNSAKSIAYEGYVAALGYMQRYDKPGNLDKAIATLQESLKADPLFALAYAQLGEAYRMKYQTERDPRWLDLALSNCQKAEQLDDRLPSAYSTLAAIHNLQGKSELALQEFHQALEINPRDAAALRGIARFDETAGKLDDAEKGFRQVIAVMPDHWDGYDELGNFYANRGRYADAVALYKQGLELAPDNAQLYSNMGSAYVDSGDAKLLPEAEKALQKSLSIHPTYAAFANLAAVYSAEQKFDQSTEFSRKALQLNDRDYTVWDTLRLDYEAVGDTVDAEKAAQGELKLLEDVESHTRSAMLEATLANLYARAGMSEKARIKIDSALSLSGDDPQVLLEVATAFANLHDRAAAIKYIREAIHRGADQGVIKTDVELKRLNIEADKELSSR